MFRSIRSSSAARVLALVAVTVTAAGCTLLGLGVGALIDRGASNRTVVADWQVATIKPGQPIDVVLGGGRQITGRFGGLHRAGPAEYAQAYDRWREIGAGGAIPVLGPGATLRTRESDSKVDLVGFDHDTVVVHHPARQEDSRIPMDTVAALSDIGGRTVDGATLLTLASTGKMPLLTRVAVDTPTRRVLVPLDEVVTVLLHKRTNAGKVTYALIGLGIDLLILATLNADPPPPTDCCASSCPWVYSFDGQKYVLEGDILGGTLFRASQRTDRLGLDHLAAVGGEYRVRLENPQQEIQYVDDAALLVIDHRPGAHVVSSAAGLSLVDAPVAPVAATDLIGQDVRALVAAADGRSWTSLPAGMGRPGTRDALRLEFPRPAEATAVTLALRTRSTIWASHLLRSLLGLHGRELPAWFARMEDQDRERQAFETAIRREGLLHVRVWDGGEWKVVGMVPPSRAAIREHAFRLAVPAGGDTLRVELTSTAGLWMVDSALADYGAEEPLTPAELRPIGARAANGADLRAVLRAPDGRAYAMNEGERADLVFTVPAPLPGRQRSLVARVSGYYTVLVPSREPGRGALFSRLVAEPGALGDYARSRLSTEIRTGGDAANGRTASLRQE
jgi:hypothetical protein